MPLYAGVFTFANRPEIALALFGRPVSELPARLARLRYLILTLLFMLSRCLLFLVAFLFVPGLASAQEIEPLLAEREKLMQQYEYYSAQKSNFWGKQSKKDLIKVIDVLKEIIRNDTKLVTAYKNEKLRHTASLTAENKQLNQQVKSDRGIIEEEFYALQNQVKTQQNKLKQRDRKIAELEQALADQKKSGNLAEQIVFGAGILLAIYLIYRFFSRANRPKSARSR